MAPESDKNWSYLTSSVHKHEQKVGEYLLQSSCGVKTQLVYFVVPIVDGSKLPV